MWKKLLKKHAVFHELALDELETTASWYEKKAEGLGEQFFKEVDRAVTAIEHSPLAWPKYFGKTRHVILKRFPFSVVYLYLADGVFIVAIADQRRAPGYWAERASNI